MSSQKIVLKWEAQEDEVDLDPVPAESEVIAAITNATFDIDVKYPPKEFIVEFRALVQFISSISRFPGGPPGAVAAPSAWIAASGRRRSGFRSPVAQRR